MLTQMKIMACFVADVSVCAASRLLNMRRPTISEYYDNFRGELYDNLLDDPISFTDNGEYEVDECLLKHVSFPRRRTHAIQWIAGILERSTGLVLLKKIPDRSAVSLIPWVVRNVPHGSVIYSDELRSYSSLGSHEYAHFTVNHSRLEYARLDHLGDEEINVHINTLEQLNREIRRRFSNKASRRSDRIDLVLGEIMYRHSGRSMYWPFKV
jgi:hypothetical protein